MSDIEDDIDVDLEVDEDEDIEDDEDDEDDEDGEDDDENDEVVDESIQSKSKNKTKYIVIVGDKRRTSNMISRSELANVVGTRAQMIESSITETIYVPIIGHKNAIEIAEAEIINRKSPLSIERVVYEDAFITKVELWEVNELIIPDII